MTLDPPAVALRTVRAGDDDAVFALESDVGASQMLAFLPRSPGDRAAFDEAWTRYTTRPDIVFRIVVADGGFAGYVLSFVIGDEREVGYWIAREHWGRGVATRALTLLLADLPERPLWGRVAGDNAGSRRVLEANGFVLDHTTRTHAAQRGAEIDELALRLD